MTIASTVASDVAAFAAELGRDDLQTRLTAAAVRAGRPATVVCVVGEFKQGKSSLINALLGRQVCPVDDDLATSTLTLLRYGDTIEAVVRRKDGDAVLVEPIAAGEIRAWVTEAGNPGNDRGVERVDVSLPHPLLEGGLVLVDTPGMGSMGAGHAANTLAFLPFADGLIFVTDASAELSAPEVDFLKRARDLCPTVVMALTKTDLYPEWRRIAQIDHDHLERIGVEVSMVALSAPVRALALANKDDRLDQRSGFPELAATLEQGVVAPAKKLAGERALGESQAALDLLEQPLRAELAVLTDPTRGAAAAAAVQQATRRLEQLRGPGARWSTVVADRVANLGNDITHRFRGQLRNLARTFDEAIEDLKTPDDWDALGRLLQSEVAEAVTDAFQAIPRGGAAIAAGVLELLVDDAADLPPIRIGSEAQHVDLGELWGTKSITERGSRAGRGFSSAITGLRGAQGGMMMFAVMGRFLPTGAAALMLSNPVTLGLGVGFGGLQVFDAHRRKLAQRRQMARTGVRQFLDDVQFDVGNTLAEAIRDLQRTLRDDFTAGVAELQRTYAESARRAQAAAERDAGTTEQRHQELSVLLTRVDALRIRINEGGAP